MRHEDVPRSVAQQITSLLRGTVMGRASERVGLLTGGQSAMNTAYKIQHRGISSSIHHMYSSSSMSSKGQCAATRARSSSDSAAANPSSSFSFLLSAMASS